MDQLEVEQAFASRERLQGVSGEPTESSVSAVQRWKGRGEIVNVARILDEVR